MRVTGWPLLLLLLALVAACEASRSFLTTRGGAVLKKGASSSVRSLVCTSVFRVGGGASSRGLRCRDRLGHLNPTPTEPDTRQGLGKAGSGKRTTVYKKQGFVARVVGGFKAFFGAYWSSLVNPQYEKELIGASKSVADASLKASAERRKRTGARRVGGINTLAPEPSSCGG